jgi:hypothetical protein
LLEFWSSRCKWVTSEQIKRNDGSCDTWSWTQLFPMIVNSDERQWTGWMKA